LLTPRQSFRITLYCLASIMYKMYLRVHTAHPLQYRSMDNCV